MSVCTSAGCTARAPSVVSRVIIVKSIRTPDQRLRVFISSTLDELAPERGAVRAAVKSMGLTPVVFEAGARPHSPRDVYRSYLEQSDVFIGLYWERYGWVPPDADVSGLEDEYRLVGDRPRLLYIKNPAPGRDARLTALIEGMEADARSCYRVFSTAEELTTLVRDDLAVLLSERFAERTAPAATDRAARLPVPATSFVGREEDLAGLVDCLVREDVRLVSLTGPGGIGKSRLAIAAAQRLRDRFPGGVHYAAVGSVRDAALLPGAIAAAAGVTVAHNRSPLDALAEHFSGAPALLLVDNFEQVVRAAGDIVFLLTAAPQLNVLVTSRTLLRVSGEHEFPVGPLATTPRATGDWVAQLASSPAVELFVDRAAAARPGFELTSESALAVAEICRRLDGVPLAIELAAARTRLLSPAALLSRLGSRLDVLGTGPTDLPERQRTLRATIEWSLDLLDIDTARRLIALAVFNDGWTAEAAGAIWQVDEVEALTHLDTLVGHSFVVASVVGEPRFRMLETIREQLADRLEADPGAEGVRARHAGYFADLLRHADMPMRTDGQNLWRPLLKPEQGNLRVAVRWMLDHAEVSSTALFLRRQLFHWWLNDHLVEARAWVAEALERAADAPAQARAELFVTAGFIAMELGDDQSARNSAARAWSALREFDDPQLRAYALLLRAWIPESAVTPVSELMRHLDEAIDILERSGESFMLGLALTSRGMNRLLLSQHDAAIAAHRRALTIGRSIANDRVVAQASSLLGITLLAAGEIDEGRMHLANGTERFLALDDSEGVALCLSLCGMVFSEHGDAERAAVALGAAEAQRRKAGIRTWPTMRPIVNATVREVRAALGEPAFDAATAEGARLSRRDAVAMALGR
jgi:predicted ATPase